MLNMKFDVIALRLAVILIPASVILYFALHTGALPDNDYWLMIREITTDYGFSHDLSSWLHRSNEHVVIIPKILYALNFLLNSGSNTGLALIAWSAALVQVLLFLLIIPKDDDNGAMRGTILLLIVSLFIFTPKAFHNWFMGMSGTAWITANMFSVASMALLYRFHLTRRQPWFWGAIITGLLAGLCYSTPLALWPALLVGAVLLRIRPRYFFAIIVAAIMAYLFYYAGYKRHPSHPELERSLFQLALFVLNFIGGLFLGENSAFARFGKVLAIAGFFLSGLVIWLRSRESATWRDECVLWLMLQAYAVGNGLLSGISRAGLGIDMALSSRYASLPAFFWLGLCAMWLVHFWRTERLRPYLPLPTVAITSLVLLMHTASFDSVQAYLYKQDRKAVASVSLLTGNIDLHILNEAVTGYLPEVLVITDRLKRIGHVPFNKWPEGWPQIGEKLDLRQMPGLDAIKGNFDSVKPFHKGEALVQGWTFHPGEKVRCVAIVNQDGVVRGLAAPGQRRPDVTFLNIADRKVGWEGYTRLVEGDLELKACVMLRTGQWFQLQALPQPEWQVN